MRNNFTRHRHRRKKSSSMSQNHELLRTSLEEIATITSYQADIQHPIIYKNFKKK